MSFSLREFAQSKLSLSHQVHRPASILDSR